MLMFLTNEPQRFFISSTKGLKKMGKDKKTFKMLSEKKEGYDKEIKKRMALDVLTILNEIDIPDDRYDQCWLAGFYYAFERIEKIFELKGGK